MKKLCAILLILFSLNIFSQSNDLDETQKAWVRVSKKKLLNADLNDAYVGFYHAYKANPDSELGKACLQKSDSIRVILGENTLDKIIGTWRLKGSYSNWGSIQKTDLDKTEKMIVISSDSLISIERDKSTDISLCINSEHIRFKSFGGMNTPSWTIYKSGKQIWTYSINNTGDILHLSNTGELDDEGETSFRVCGTPNLIYERVQNKPFNK